jgi:predicted nucleic acid-binding protein
VLASSIAMKRMTLTLAQNFLAKVIDLFDGKLARVDHPLVLAIAARHRVSAYDARFLALADQLGTRLVTEDAKLRAAAPALTQSLTEALGKE